MRRRPRSAVTAPGSGAGLGADGQHRGENGHRRRPGRPAPRRRLSGLQRRQPGLPGNAVRQADADQAQPEVHLRDVRHRLEQQVRARRRGRRRRSPGQGLQPAVHLRRLRAGQDPPAARHRPLRPEPVPGRPGPVRELRRVHQRLHQHDQGRQAGRLPPPLPGRRRAAGRRHPVPGEQGRHPGGVLPHLQHAAQRDQADRDLQRPRARSGWSRSRTGCGAGSSGACSPTSSRPSSRPGSRSCARRPCRTG